MARRGEWYYRRSPERPRSGGRCSHGSRCGSPINPTLGTRACPRPGLSGLLLVTFGSSAQAVLDPVWPPVLLAMVIWMVVQARQHCAAGAGSGPGPHGRGDGTRRGWRDLMTVEAATDDEVAMPGQLIVVNGHMMHLSCTGSGSPTVVLQPGGGGMSATMGWTAARLAAETRVSTTTAQARDGANPSPTPKTPPTSPATSNVVAARQRPRTLRAGGALVRCLYVLTYAAKYPDEVAGLAVIDTTPPRDEPTTSTPDAPDAYDALSRATALVSTLSQLGVSRLEAGVEPVTLPPGPTTRCSPA